MHGKRVQGSVLKYTIAAATWHKRGPCILFSGSNPTVTLVRAVGIGSCAFLIKLALSDNFFWIPVVNLLDATAYQLENTSSCTITEVKQR